MLNLTFGYHDYRRRYIGDNATHERATKHKSYWEIAVYVNLNPRYSSLFCSAAASNILKQLPAEAICGLKTFSPWKGFRELCRRKSALWQNNRNLSKSS